MQAKKGASNHLTKLLVLHAVHKLISSTNIYIYTH